MVYYYLKSLKTYDIVDSSFNEKLHDGSILLDVRDDEKLNELIVTEQPDVVINCIGVLIKGSQKDPSNAIYLNAYLPHRLAKILRNTGGRLIHISTDCVFSGKKGNYAESDFRDADDIYGRSKALGEVNNDIDLTLRTSIIGPELKQEGEGLFHWFMQQKGNISGFMEAFWGGVTTLELSKLISIVIERNITGVINVTNEQPISKYDLLNLIRDIFNLQNIYIEPFTGKKIDKSLISDRNELKNVIPSYDQMISEMKMSMIEKRDIYVKYYKKIYLP